MRLVPPSRHPAQVFRRVVEASRRFASALRRAPLPVEFVRAAFSESLEPRVLLSSYYVSTSGSDGAPGSLGSPFRTIQQAANVAQPGDTVLVRAGTYRETVTPARSGTSGKPITYKDRKSVV